MAKTIYFSLFISFLSFTHLFGQVCIIRGPKKLYNEDSLKVVYEKFSDSLDVMAITRGYPKAIENLLSPLAEKKKMGLKTLSATLEIEAIPWIIPLLNSEDHYVSGEASLALERLVFYTVLKRRDANPPERITILPLGPNDPNLTPLAWIILKMFRSRQHTINGNAATMAGYLNLAIFRKELETLTHSPHPAYVNAATHALDMIENGHRQ